MSRSYVDLRKKRKLLSIEKLRNIIFKNKNVYEIEFFQIFLISIHDIDGEKDNI